MTDRERRREPRWEQPRPERRGAEPDAPAPRKGAPFPEAPADPAKPGDPPLEQPFGDRSRNGKRDDPEPAR